MLEPAEQSVQRPVYLPQSLSDEFNKLLKKLNLSFSKAVNEMIKKEIQTQKQKESKIKK